MASSEHRRPALALWASVVFLLISAAVFFAIWNSHSERSQAMPASAPATSNPLGAAASRSVAPEPPRPALRPERAAAGARLHPTLPLPAGMEPRQVAARYRDLNSRATASTNTLRGLLDADPAKYQYVRWKLHDAGYAIYPLAVIEAINDPTLRPIFTEKLLNPAEFKTVVEWLTESGMDANQLAGIPTPEDALATLASREKFFEGRYRESLHRLGIPREVSALLPDSAGAGWLRINVSEYMQNHGFFYDPQEQAFLPGDGGADSNAMIGTFLSIGREAE